jgi:hypothetical protein
MLRRRNQQLKPQSILQALAQSAAALYSSRSGAPANDVRDAALRPASFIQTE